MSKKRLFIFVVLLVFCLRGEASAQWATNGANINNTNTGNVGIGTANPTYAKLQVNGSIRIDDDSASPTGSDTLLGAPSMYIGTTTGGNVFQYNGGGGLDLWQYNGGWGKTVTFAKSGNVGLGTNSPGVLNGINFSGYIPLHIQGSGARYVVIDSAISNSGLVLNDSSQAANNRIWGVTQAAGGGKLTFSTYTDAGTISNKVVIDRSGNMGIGTTTPGSRLHVAGDITVDGNINAKYQDVAEWVPSKQQLSAGTVVVLDRAEMNHVLASTRPYDTAVAGVISAQPGIALGEKGGSKVLVATTGRVKVRVDATRAPIRVGDLLVTSETPGVAMRSEPLDLGGVAIHRPGTLIGKALEPLAKGTGEILVLLSLQ